MKVVSNDLTPDEGLETKRIEAEVEENLRQMEEEKARRDQIAGFLAAWDRRGERFDRLVDRIEKLLDRYGGTSGK